MSAEVIKVFNYIGEKLGIAIDWTQENIMPYLEDLVARFVKLNVIEAGLGVFICLICFIVSLIFFVKMIKTFFQYQKTNESNFFWEEGEYYDTALTIPTIILTIICGICLLIGIIGVPMNISELIKWIYIPEFQIVEEISYMMKTMGA